MIIKYILFLLLILINPVYATEFNVEPLRTDKIGGSLGDIDCRMWTAKGMVSNGKVYTWMDYRDDDKVTWAHEGTHSVNSRIRWETKKSNGYYLLDSQGIIMSNPDLTLTQIAKAIPKDKRGQIYDTYLVKSARWWNDTPLYILDELVAYTNGTIVGVEYNLKRRAKESHKHAMELYGYCKIAYELCKEKEYKDLPELKKVLDMIQNRLNVLEDMINK